MVEDFIEKDGQLVIGDSRAFHIEDLLRFCKGWHKFAPYVGVCVGDLIADEGTLADLSARIYEELTQDGMQNIQITLNHKTIQIHGNYNTRTTRTESL